MNFVRCKSCLYPSTKPDLHFVDGECSACRNHRHRSNIDWGERKAIFVETITKRAKGTASGYDCIVPSSGGKDSTYQVMTLLNLGIRPLVVTASTCHLTPIGRQNIDNLSRRATTIEYTPNRNVRSILNKIGLSLVGDISLPEHFAIFSIPFRAAVNFGIPTIVYGECPTAEYGGPPDSERHMEMTRRYIMEHQGFLGMRPSDFVGMGGGIRKEDMMDYTLPDDSKLRDISAMFLGQYIPWDSRENAKVAINAGMQVQLPSGANWWVFENLDNAQTGIHDWFGYLKYGYGRGAAQLSVDIRNGFITRERAFHVARDIEGVFPDQYAGVKFSDMIERIGMDRRSFFACADKFTNRDIFDTVPSKCDRLLPPDMR